MVVAGGAGDNAAAACGVGVVTPGAAFVSIGTSGVLFVSNARFSPNTEGAVHAFCHAIPDTWHQMGVILSAADSLEWLARITGRKRRPSSPPRSAGSRRPRTSPSCPTSPASARRTTTPRARGAFAGLSQSTDLADLAQAVMEGVAYAFADCQRVLNDAGTDFASALAVGGGARSDDLAPDHRQRARPPARDRRRQRRRRGARRRPARDLRRRGRRPGRGLRRARKSCG